MHDFSPQRLRFSHSRGCQFQVYLFKGIRGAATHKECAVPTLTRLVDPCTLSWRHELSTYIGLTDSDAVVCVKHSVINALLSKSLLTSLLCKVCSYWLSLEVLSHVTSCLNSVDVALQVDSLS